MWSCSEAAAASDSRSGGRDVKALLSLPLPALYSRGAEGAGHLVCSPFGHACLRAPIYTALHASGFASFHDPLPRRLRRKRQKSAALPDEVAGGSDLPTAVLQKARSPDASAHWNSAL